MAAETSYEGAFPSEIDFDELSYRISSRNEHPVVQYVRELPFESAVYPANMYHGLSDGSDGCRKGLITWCPPGHDQERPKRKGCGFIREKGSVGDEGIRFTACSSDTEHYIKGRRTHCWSLHCPSCMNDTALRMGSRVEEQLGAYRILMEKRGADPGRLGHWVVSPPQDMAKAAVQTIDGYNRLRRQIEERLQDVGAKAGCLVFHPWRQGEDLWAFSPHFHSILFGFLDTDRFRAENPGWVIKKVHASEEVESVGQTAAYLMTHMGLGVVERDPSDVDYDLRFLCHMLPGLGDDSKGSEEDGRDFRFTDQDVSDEIEGKGRMVGDLSDMDWLDFAMRPLSYPLRMTYFGMASQRSIRTVDVEREYRTRVCRECGRPLNVYGGLCDHEGEPARFLFENTIRAFCPDIGKVRQAIRSIESEAPGKTKLSEISPSVQLIVSKEETLGFMNNGGSDGGGLDGRSISGCN
jgi:hypothetical protein